MSFRLKIERDWWTALGAFLAWAVVFAILYAQSPLYTSNQNQYFLHGMARAGLGLLNRDWLANTPDPTPVFSALIALTYALTHSNLLFYIYYALLMGVYLFSVYGLMDLLFDLRSSKTRSLLFLALFLAAHSAALRYLLSKTFGSWPPFWWKAGWLVSACSDRSFSRAPLPFSWCCPFTFSWPKGATGPSWRWWWPSRSIRLICYAAGS
jgi:hypothetical protein